MTQLADYENKYEHAAFERRENGLLRVTLHTDGGPLDYHLGVHHEWTTLWDDIARDDANRLVIITGAGDAFIPARQAPPPHLAKSPKYTPEQYHPLLRDGLLHIAGLLSIPVPVIAAVNGPARVHAEIALMSDIVLATPDAEFQDQPHLPNQIVPGDGIHVIMPYLMGRVRGAYFLMLGERLGVQEAQRMGLVNEIVERDALLPRAEEIAAKLLNQPDHNLRYTRLILTHDLKEKMHHHLAMACGLQGLASLSNDWTNWPFPAD